MANKEFYPKSCEAFRTIIKNAFPNAHSEEGLDDKDKVPLHLLWMLDRIESMTEDPYKASRWIGYVIGRAEALGLLNNKQSRDIVRKDIE